MTKRELAKKQIELMDDIRFKANINMVTCGHCGTIILHEMNDEPIDCFSCMSTMEQSDCPDYWYTGCEDSSEFND
jgi:hypothetical protein